MELTYLYFLPVTIVVAWIVAFIAAGRYRLPGDRIFLAFLTAGGMTLFVTQHLMQSVCYDNLYFAFMGLELLFEMSICPLLFIYMRSVARDARWHNGYLWLFAPAVLLCMDVFVFHLINVSNHCYFVTIATMETVLTAMSIYYLVRYQRHSEDFFANIEDSSSDKMRNVLVSAIILMLSMIVVSGLYKYISDIKGFLLIRSLWFSVVVWMIASNAYKIKTILPPLIEKMGELDEETTRNDDTEDLSSVETDEALAKKIASWIEQPDKPYCKEGLTIVDMAEQIDDDPRAISAYIKSALPDSPNRKNFSHWINTLRIEEAKRLLRTYPDYKINYISTLCGYPTQSTFSRAFQQIVGQSPRSYRETQVLRKAPMAGLYLL